MRTVIVTGGRDYADRTTIFSALDAIWPDRVVQGGAPGADTLARDWAEMWLRECVTVEADWKTHGKSAGPLRNRKMLMGYDSKNTVVVAFPGGAGTENCVKTARELGMVVLRVEK